MGNFDLYILLAATVLVALLGNWWRQEKGISEGKALLVMVGILIVVNVVVFGLEWLFSG
jgi:hypothetical protein